MVCISVNAKTNWFLFFSANFLTHTYPAPKKTFAIPMPYQGMKKCSGTGKKKQDRRSDYE